MNIHLRNQHYILAWVLLGSFAVLLASMIIAKGNPVLVFSVAAGTFLLIIGIRSPFSILVLVTFFTPLEPFTTFQGATLNRYLLLILLLVWVAKLLTGKKKPVLEWPILGMFVWVALGILSYLWAPTTNYLIQNIFGYFFALVLLTIISDLVNNHQQLIWILGALLAGLLVVLVLWIFNSENNLLGFFVPIIGTGSLSSYGKLVGLILACYITLALYGRSREKLLGLIVIFPAMYLFLASGLRRTLLTTASVLFAFLILQKPISWKTAVLVLIILFIGLYGFEEISPQLPSLIQNRFTIEDIVETRGSGRLVLYKLALNIWRKSPFLGIGMGNFGYYSGQIFHIPLTTHNAYLESLVETGLVGFILWSASFFAILWNSIKTFRASEGFPDKLLAALPMSLLVFMAATSLIASIQIYRPFWLALGIGIASTKILKTKIPENPVELPVSDN